MKKVYEKPALHIERFALTQTIALNCGSNLDFGMATQATKETCGWDVGAYEIFMDRQICDRPTKEFDGACYNAPAGGYNIFAS